MNKVKGTISASTHRHFSVALKKWVVDAYWDLATSIFFKDGHNLENKFNLGVGMSPCTTTFNSDGSITEVGIKGTKTTIFNTDGSITESIIYTDGEGVSKLTVFNTDGSITETFTETNE